MSQIHCRHNYRLEARIVYKSYITSPTKFHTSWLASKGVNIVSLPTFVRCSKTEHVNRAISSFLKFCMYNKAISSCLIASVIDIMIYFFSLHKIHISKVNRWRCQMVLNMLLLFWSACRSQLQCGLLIVNKGCLILDGIQFNFNLK